LNILIAEDEPEILRLYEIVLGAEGYKVSTTIDGQECVQAYTAAHNSGNPFDLVILDYRMPRKNGVEVAKEILALCPTQDLLMITAYKEQRDLQDQTVKKMQILEKPFDMDALVLVVRQLTNRRLA
jgi:CheY-like chemotaxis protein